MTSGRTCPLGYRYSATVFKRIADLQAATIYVIGGLYGNRAALAEILKMAALEKVAPTLVFNGDFNWFNIHPDDFVAVNTEVMKHIALRGNVETELASDGASDTGCGCVYPDYVDDADVERSNQIIQKLRGTASAFPELSARLASLPMHLVAQVGPDDTKRFGIVHGDAESLAGWRFAHDSLHDAENGAWLRRTCSAANLIGFASSHTCLPTFRLFNTPNTAGIMNTANAAAATHMVINNGAAGMPNFAGTEYGLISRLSVHPPHEDLSQYGSVVDGIYIDALPVHYDAQSFRENFLADWAPGTPGHQSYFQRILHGPSYAPPHALGLVRAPSVCA